jgi:hypothetical protein
MNLRTSLPCAPTATTGDESRLDEIGLPALVLHVGEVRTPPIGLAISADELGLDHFRGHSSWREEQALVRHGCGQNPPFSRPRGA